MISVVTTCRARRKRLMKKKLISRRVQCTLFGSRSNRSVDRKQSHPSGRPHCECRYRSPLDFSRIYVVSCIHYTVAVARVRSALRLPFYSHPICTFVFTFYNTSFAKYYLFLVHVLLLFNYHEPTTSCSLR